MKNFFILLILFSFCSCIVKRKLYSSTQINNPSLKEKNDHSFSLAYSDPSGFDFTGGYAITNRIAIIGGAYSYRNREKQNETFLFSDITHNASLLYRHKGFHGGLGYYFPVSKSKNPTYLSFFGGYTKGSFRMDEDYTETDNSSGTVSSRQSFYKSDISRYFLQAGVNGYFNDFEISFLSRYNYVVYDDVITNYSITDQHDFSLPPSGYSKNSQFLDFGFDSKYFFSKDQRIGLQLFAYGTTRLNRKEFNFYYHDFRFGFGIVAKNIFRKK